jgi:hypothetical protein
MLVFQCEDRPIQAPQDEYFPCFHAIFSLFQLTASMADSGNAVKEIMINGFS